MNKILSAIKSDLLSIKIINELIRENVTRIN